MSKYVAMMRKQVSYKEHYANKSEVPAAAEIYRSEAADWRAMREAWEAMVEAITQLCEDADEHDLLRDYVTVDRVLYENLTAALAKARGE